MICFCLICELITCELKHVNFYRIPLHFHFTIDPNPREIRFGLGHGLVLNWRQAIIYTNVDPVLKRLKAALG